MSWSEAKIIVAGRVNQERKQIPVIGDPEQ